MYSAELLSAALRRCLPLLLRIAIASPYSGYPSPEQNVYIRRRELGVGSTFWLTLNGVTPCMPHSRGLALRRLVGDEATAAWATVAWATAAWATAAWATGDVHEATTTSCVALGDV